MKLDGKGIIWSDLHLGSNQSKITVHDVLEITAYIKPDWMVFNGDTVDLFANKHSRRLVDQIIGFAHCCCFVISGNHDDVFPLEVFWFKNGGKVFKVFHGHQYEKKIVRCCDPILTFLNDKILGLTGINIQDWIRKYRAEEFPQGKFEPHLYDQRTQILLDHEKTELDFLITGHTHYPEMSNHLHFKYVNPGNWETFVLVNNGNVELRRVKDELC